ncbi:MAG: tRNA (cytidine(34)-2'-O)-methyltransferase [Phycisphaeraceae bacterium]|nr:tRNA (cytidine(34)-2'-O)-methyltransferase [Phycisphaeraceae bacterium]
MARPLFHIVLHEPEIPNNTGNIGRTCVATGCALHLIHPLGFSTSEKACRRAGLDYWPRLSPSEHAGWEEFCRDQAPANLWLLTTKSARPAWEVPLRPGDYLVFGKESKGLPDELLAAHPDRLITLPMVAEERSLNLATAVCAVVYEGVRQRVASGDLSLDATGRLRDA